MRVVRAEGITGPRPFKGGMRGLGLSKILLTSEFQKRSMK